MKLIDMIDNISNIALTYYLYHHTIDNTTFHRKDVVSYLSDHLLQYFCTKEDPDSDVVSIYVLFGIDEREYDTTSTLDQSCWIEIQNHIMFCITHGLYIHNRENIISVNVVPFDGFPITKWMIFSILDKYFYK